MIQIVICSRLDVQSIDIPVIANEVKQSRTPTCMDCRASRHVSLKAQGLFAVTKSL